MKTDKKVVNFDKSIVTLGRWLTYKNFWVQTEMDNDQSETKPRLILPKTSTFCWQHQQYQKQEQVSGRCLLFHLEAEPVEVPVVQELPRLPRRLLAELLDQPVTLRPACLQKSQNTRNFSIVRIYTQTLRLSYPKQHWENCIQPCEQSLKPWLLVGCGLAWHLLMVFDQTTGWLLPGLASFQGTRYKSSLLKIKWNQC